MLLKTFPQQTSYAKGFRDILTFTRSSTKHFSTPFPGQILIIFQYLVIFRLLKSTPTLKTPSTNSTFVRRGNSTLSCITGFPTISGFDRVAANNKLREPTTDMLTLGFCTEDTRFWRVSNDCVFVKLFQKITAFDGNRNSDLGFTIFQVCVKIFCSLFQIEWFT